MNLAREDELLPLFVLIRQFIEHPDLPVPISLTFGIHTLLTSLFEMQGNNDIQDLGITTKVRQPFASFLAFAIIQTVIKKLQF